LDPVSKPWQSDYSCLSGNPIWRLDPDGDDDYFNADGTYNAVESAKHKEGTKIIVQTAEGNKTLSQINTFKGNNAKTVANITSYYAARVGVTEGGIVGVDRAVKSENGTRTLAYSIGDKEKPEIYLNATGGFVHNHLDDYNNLKSVLTHEKKHNLEGDPEKIDYTFFQHASIYEFQFNDATTFQKTTFDFKVHQASAYASYLSAAYNNDEIDNDQLNTKIDEYNKRGFGIKIDGSANNNGVLQLHLEYKKDGKDVKTLAIPDATDPH
jgi:hypothetical protein